MAKRAIFKFFKGDEVCLFTTNDISIYNKVKTPFDSFDAMQSAGFVHPHFRMFMQGVEVDNGHTYIKVFIPELEKTHYIWGGSNKFEVGYLGS